MYKRELSGGADWCVVAAMARYVTAHPDRYRGEGSLLPLFPMQRGRVAETLVAAGARCGCEPGDLGTHSLRIGGASALWNTFRDTALVQRWGRWTSSAFQGPGGRRSGHDDRGGPRPGHEERCTVGDRATPGRLIDVARCGTASTLGGGVRWRSQEGPTRLRSGGARVASPPPCRPPHVSPPLSSPPTHPILTQSPHHHPTPLTP